MSTTSKKKKGKGKIVYGNVSLPPDTFHPRNVKLRVTMMVDEDIVDAFRAAAEKRGIGYQTLMNEKLREALPELDKTLADQVKELLERMESVEEIVRERKEGYG